jgi:hypothetical protein
MICTRKQADVASAEEGAKKQQSRRAHTKTHSTASRREGLCGTSIFFGEGLSSASCSQALNQSRLSQNK